MKNLAVHFFTVCLLGALLGGCTKAEVDPKAAQVEADRNETEAILKDYLQQGDMFSVVIYSPRSTDTTKYLIKTTNQQISFDQHKLVVRPGGLTFHVDRYDGSRVEYKTRYPGESRQVKTMDIYFRAN